jgi:hypothetical protein
MSLVSDGVDEMAVSNIAGMIQRGSFHFAFGWLAAMRVHSTLSADVGKRLQAELESAFKTHIEQKSSVSNG